MGLFSKHNDAEKKLKELTGGFLLSSTFMKQLEKYGLTVSEGVEIKNEIKRKIKEENLPSHKVVDEIVYQLKERSLRKPTNENGLDKETTIIFGDNTVVNLDSKGNPIKTNNKNKLGADKWFKYALNQENMVKKCPKCNSKNLKDDKFCYKCGVKLPKHNPLNNEKPVKKVEEKPNTSNVNTLEELEQLYSEKISDDYSTSFKFAYTIFLDQLSRNPTKEFNEYYGSEFDTNAKLLKKQAKEDNFIKKGSPITSVKGSRVKDIKEVLKENDLKVSGNKKELIERINENLTDEEIKKAFPGKSIEVTKEGLDFIEENKHILLYPKNNIKYTISPDEFDKLITKNEEYKQKPTDKTIYKILLEYYNEKEAEKIEEWYDYRELLTAMSSIYTKLDNNEKHLETDFKIFLLYLNKYIIYYRRGYTQDDNIREDFTEKLIKLINNLNYNIDDLKRIFHNAFTSFKPKELIILEEDALIYLLKLFNGEKESNIVKEIKNKY